MKKVANKHINKEISAMGDDSKKKGGKVNDIGEVGKNPASNNIRGDIMGIMKGQS
jgi:hypothetical protein|tara:strand:- start:305 stop:469 length:165 start_codon:yes stop_codon:yes gene_type:complete